jgi:nitroimidazol reductase NimA-like FMN-containing flavoprotein (pyridoxamine 5'-phosphate oxidase superfamily)
MRLAASVRKFLERERVVRVATVGRDGVPQVLPVCHVMKDGKIYFAADKESKKVKNLRAHPQAAVEADLYSEDWPHLAGAVVTGPATLSDRGPHFRQLRSLLYQKYPQYAADSALKQGEVVMVEVIPSRLVSWGLD